MPQSAATQLETKLDNARVAYNASDLKKKLGVDIGQPVSSNSDVQKMVDDLDAMSDTDPWRPFTAMVYCTALNKYDVEYANIIAPIAGDNPNMPVDVVTQKNTQLQTDIAALTTRRDDLLIDKQAAQLRDDVLRTGNGAVTNHQIYLLGRPLRPASIPYLWALSVLFIGLAILIFYMFYPYTSPPWDVFVFDLYLLFKDPMTWGILFSLASVIILFLSLRIAKII
jgi:hypothetical protein